MPTLADVAKLAGVGVMSVSRVVNGTRRVSPEVERKVRTAIEKIGYRPNEAARVLRGTKSTVLGVIVPDLADPFFAACCSAIQEVAWDAGYMTLIAASGHREEMERRDTDIMVQRQVAGLLVAPIGSHNDHFMAARRAGIPLVALDRPIDQVESDSLTVDNLKASSQATQHLISHGHRRILCIADDERIYTKSERVAGYSNAMRKANLAARVCIVGSVAGTVADQLSLLLDSDQAPTAIFAASNHVGIDVLKYLQQNSIDIPGRIALLCFDDFSAATLVSPAITVIEQPIVALGQRAAQMMFERLRSPTQSPPSQVTLPTRLVLRQSCGC